ncbi:recombination-associated protein RdgC [Alkalilimnicola sp. S0819]|uniref:recombination-associated protein RdgC n=1 Tax=Alkalilimnicola sp. S0819 TaxID=2613922 RepID=UPI001261F6C6|nr:recombination-associated protein RdgC [Alkalilimnicola sp. S0819]KAB7622977.1 recombination-associated protein RdgC [Alkalilimnicola sp. S0819]MPQ17086.1 recombination-associated protein RdgC [Alkalilimnicola sp. S0819]
MWFKNLCAYRLQEAFTLEAEALEEKLATKGFEPCGRIDLNSQGWVSPLGAEGEMLVHVTNGYLMLCLKEESKILPASVVREGVQERVAEREEKEQRKVRKKERDQLRDEVTLELLPRAFTRSKHIYGYIDPKDGWLVIDAASWKQAEAFSEFLRETLGSLPIAPPVTVDAPQAIMTDWVAKDQPPADVELGEEAVFEDPRTEGCEIRCKRQDLQADEIKGHITSGKHIRRLGVSWDQRLSCVLDADYSVKRLKFSDLVQEELGDRDPESAAERFDLDFAILSLELSRFLPRLMAMFGGEEARG